MNPGIEFYESILDTTTLRAYDLYGPAEYRHFCHPESIHTFTRAFGVPQPRLCCFCEDVAKADFDLPPFQNTPVRKSRFLLKIVAAWKNWRLYTHPSTITLNGQAIHDGPLFLENVSKGWPGIYFEVPAEYLRRKNHIEIVNGSAGKNTLLIERIEILRLKDARDFSVLYCPDFANAGSRFYIKLNLFKRYSDIKLNFSKRDIRFIKRSGSMFWFEALRPSKNIGVSFNSKDMSCKAVIGEILPPRAGREVFVGFDCDDIRQDKTRELDRILEHLAYTQMGDFIAFRPKITRNYPPKFPAEMSDWRRWMDFCRAHDIKFQFSGLPEWPAKELKALKKEIVLRGGKNFEGFQIHEPYCMSFSPTLKNPPAIKRAKDFVEKKKTYLDFVNSQVDAIRYGKARVFCGDPSLLCVYLKESKVDNILCEPVSNSALLFGAARGTGKDFGAHLAPDWYCGFPHDQRAIDRVSLLLDLIYAAGGKHIYLESTAFKTNAFSRNDWEDEFCVSARQLLRQFYRFTCSDSRLGQPEVPLAFVFGNLESMFWRPDDRIPELADSGNWDNVVWGKWPDTGYRWLWKAGDAWLPPLEMKDFGKNESLTKMFSGSPYGQVDVISPYADLDKYKAIAFLGWNTMDAKIYRNLIDYVSRGGTVFMMACHFDTRIDPTSDPRFIRGGRVSELLGANIIGPGPKVLGNCRTAQLALSSAVKIDDYLYANKLGRGNVYWMNFYDYPTDMRIVNMIHARLSDIGLQVSKKSDVQLSGPDAKFMNYTLWRDGRSRKVYLTNIDWQDKAGRKIVLNNRGKKIRLSVPGGKTLVVNL